MKGLSCAACDCVFGVEVLVRMRQWIGLGQPTQKNANTHKHPPNFHIQQQQAQQTMVKKRRGTSGSKKLRNKKNNEQFFKKPKGGIIDPTVRTAWRGKKSIQTNLLPLGITNDINKRKPQLPQQEQEEEQRGDKQQQELHRSAEEIFSLPPPEVRDRNPRRRLMSEEVSIHVYVM